MTLLSFNLSELDGTNGFIINGISTEDFLGVVSDAGDINGDGIDDVIVGASGADVNGSYSGQAYVVFGQQGGFSPILNLADLNGTNGFMINGINTEDLLGLVSDAGDINDDGIDDVIVGAPYADPNGSDSSGQAYVVFGQQGGFSPSLNLADLNGSNGFALNNIAEYRLDYVSDAGDINGDGIDDVIVGTHPFSPTNPGQAYVVFGQQGRFSPSLNLADLNGSNGFVLNGIGFNDIIELFVSAAGDINGDGIDDLVIGLKRLSGNYSGQVYVVFGNQGGFNSSFNLSRLDGTNGFILNGTDGDRLGLVSDAGDINGDGIDDLIVGASGAVSNGVASGQTYVVFGRREEFSPSLNLSDLNGSNGFAINGIGSNDLSSYAISGAGDINGDGIDDLIIGAPLADPNGNASGQSYVVYGREGGFAPSLNLADLNGGNGFALNGINSGDVSGASVSGAGDINNDGIDDLIISAAYADPNGDFSGQSYVVYGRRGGFIPLVDTLVDENDGDLSPGDVSLREAISIAGNGATIAFSSNLNGGEIALTLGELEITNNITINGLGENNLTISGSNESQIFRIAGNAEVNIDGLTITNGFSDTNGGAIDNRGVLNLSNTTVRNSFTTADGGGINNLGTLNLLNTTLSNNTAGINGGAITNRGTITATNSIVSTNIALNNGGGIFNLNGTLQLVSNTITNNIVSGNGGGIYSFVGQTTVNNTIIAGNLDQGGESPDVNGLFTSNGYNLIGINDGSIGFVNDVNGNIVGTRTNPINPLLGSLENNHVPSIIGPAFDSGDPSLTGSDRFRNPRLQSEGVDIGAVEFQFLDTVTVDNLTDEFDGDLSSGDVSLREAIFITAAGGTINFAPSLTGGNISLTLGTLNLNRNITIQGLGANNLTVDGNNTFSIFSINNNANTNISGLTLVNADNSAIVNNGTLILSDSTVRNSRGRFAGGIENQGNLTVINSTINNNIEEEGEGGGGIFNQGNATLIDTTISNNSSGGILNNSSFILINSTVSNNNGRGIRNAGTFTLYNATISGNQSNNNGGGIINTGTLRVTNSTITNNSAIQGGGIVNSGTAILGNTIVAGNNIIDGNVNLINHFDVEGNFISNGNNLIGSNEGSTGFINTNNGDIVGTNISPINPRLGTLQDNGGATFTHALLDDSIAINSGNNANLPEDIADLDGDNNISEPLPVDQRGVTRAQNGYVDIGAFESNIETRSIVSFQVIDSQANEKGGNFGRYILTRTASREGLTALTVNLSLDSGNTATFSDDYNLVVNGTVINSINSNLNITFAQGQSQLNIDLIPVDDVLLEDAETITLTLNQAIEYAVDPINNSGTVTIDPSDPLSIVTIQATDSQANERGGDLGRYTLTRTASDGELRELTINLSLDAGNTATLTDDYILEVNGTVITPINDNFSLTFAQGQSELNIDLIPVDEFVNEDAETITLNLNQSSEYAVDPNNNSASVAIAPSDPLSIVTIQATASQVNEEEDLGRYTLTRTASEGEFRELTINLSLGSGNTATLSNDYNLEVNDTVITPINGNFSITFSQGQSQLNIDLIPVDDSFTEDAETITLNINEALEYAVDPINNSATVTIAPSEQPVPQNHPLSTVDVGFYSVPTFIDENNDGDLDLFIGALDGTIAVAHNQGTATNPNFANPIIIRDVGNRSTPTFADIDGDGDQDLFAGDTFGRIHYYRNRGSVNGASFAAPIINPFGFSGGGGLANPDFVDIDGDGDQDLFVGTADGRILFYRNTGNRTNPNFVISTTNPFGLQAVVGAAAPHFVDVGDDGDFDAFIGASDGRTRYFENVGTMTTPSFIERSTPNFNNALPDVGNNATPFLADINGDGFLDAFIGAENGTVRFVNAVVRGGEYPVPVNVGNGTIVLGGFRGVGTEDNPESNSFVVDELHFFGEGLIAENLLLTQDGEDLKVSFAGIANTEVILRGFDLENFDNLANGIGNILFEGDTSIQDSFDVFDVDSKDNRVFQPNTVTFLNDLDNNVRGFNNSDDVINGQGGDDKIWGLGGDDLLRGGQDDDRLTGGSGNDFLVGDEGDDRLMGGSGDDTLIGGIGSDIIRGGSGNDVFRFGGDIFQDGLLDRDTIQDFQVGDSFDFSGYLVVGGEVSFTRNQRNLIIDLSNEDSIIVRGNLDATQQQLEAILG